MIMYRRTRRPAGAVFFPRQPRSGGTTRSFRKDLSPNGSGRLPPLGPPGVQFSIRSEPVTVFWHSRRMIIGPGSRFAAYSHCCYYYTSTRIIRYRTAPPARVHIVTLFRVTVRQYDLYCCTIACCDITPERVALDAITIFSRHSSRQGTLLRAEVDIIWY